MTKEKTIQFLMKELEKINKKIDKKIVLGQNYSKESREHLDLYLAIKDMKKGIYA